MRFLSFVILSSLSVWQCRPHDPKSIVSFIGAAREIPILCYHNIRNQMDHHSPELTVTEKTFAEEMKWLADSGYHTIVPDQLYDHLTKGSALPSKPIMLTFDDSHEEHFSIAAREMNKYGFKGVFFVMTIALDKPGYLTREEIKTLAQQGHTIADHTYDHPLLTKLNDSGWTTEIDKPRKLLELITGKPVDYFAYPYGAWNERAIDELKQRGIKAAFQLSEPEDARDPLFTLRRIMVSDDWSTAKLNREIQTAFNQRDFAYLKK